MTISYSNLKSESQKIEDNAQSAMVSQWCADRRDAGEVAELRPSPQAKSTSSLYHSVYDGFLWICTPQRAQGLAREEMTTRETRQMHPVTLGEDATPYPEKNRRQAKRYLEAHVNGSFAGIPAKGFAIVGNYLPEADAHNA